jgi:hypothetical protein
MATINFKIKIDKDQLMEFIDEKLDEIADDILANSQSIIVDKGIVDMGTLLKSGNINRDFLAKEIIYSVPYADQIEFGRLPGSMPPITPIKDWVLRKGIAKDEKEANSIAWAISQDIKMNGMEPRPFLGPAIEQTKIRFKTK